MTDVRPREELEAKYREESGDFFLTGVQALVRVPIEQMRADRRHGLRTAAFVSGYQGSPLGGFDLELASRRTILDGLDIVHQPGLNEELAATAVMGSQLSSTFPSQRFDGVVGIWYGKAPGVDRAGDAFRHAAYAGTHRTGGVLAMAGDDPANKSSSLPSSSEHALADVHMPILHPGNVQEVLDLGAHGIALSRACGLWTALKVVTVVADGSGIAEVGGHRVSPVMPEVDWNGAPFVPVVNPTLLGRPAIEMEAEIYDVRMDVARRYAVVNELNKVTHDAPGAWLGIIASGHLYHEVIAALAGLGLDDAALAARGVRVMQLGMLHPFDRDTLRHFGRGLDEIVVVEEKRPFIESHLRDALYGVADAPQISGKTDPDGIRLVPQHGALSTAQVEAALRRRLLTRLDPAVLTPEQPAAPSRRLLPVLPARAPYFCSGCPHSTGTRAPADSLIGTGIGCHGMPDVIAPSRTGRPMGNTHMGGEGSQWVGIEPFVDIDHFIQNLGDGTFAHSGSLSIRQAVAANSHITFKLLYNSAVAMTGGQDAPGAMAVDKIATWALCEGVARVIITTDDRGRYRKVEVPRGVEVWDRSRIVEAQEVLATVPGVTLLIHDQQCAAEKRRDRKRGLIPDAPRRVVINERVCEGCGDCGVKSNCLSVQPVDTTYGRKTRIDQSSCNKDYTCLDGDCPSFVTVTPKRRSKTAAPDRSGGGARRRPPLEASELPDPVALFGGDDVKIRMPGIGGTGVVTVSQVLAMAAKLDGRHVSGLDQTGLSQKAGAVVSDLQVSAGDRARTETEASSVDLYLVFDLLVGLTPANLNATSPASTVAVVSTTRTASGPMVRDVGASYPDEAAMRAQLDATTRCEHNRYLDTVAVTEGLFGDATTANILQVGIAYQIGALPLSATSIEQAIEVNGVAVEANKLAFRWGRMWAIDPERVAAASPASKNHTETPPSEAIRRAVENAGLGGDVARVALARATDLADYQNEAYALRYLDTVGTAAATGHPTYAAAVAQYLHKLMAYKDEYEVARLHLETAARAAVEEAVGGDVKVSWNLHPPILRTLGMDRKIRLGPWFTPAMKGLKAARKLRGTPIDVFGYTEMRRLERRLVTDYEQIVARLNPRVTTENLDRAIALASLPDMVRGYEDIKLDNVERYHSELERACKELEI
ncbi:MAG: indolepyruvate ferredoxin oxidoreductase family protein [Acidimicrobiales bacterium]